MNAQQLITNLNKLAELEKKKADNKALDYMDRAIAGGTSIGLLTAAVEIQEALKRGEIR